MLGLGLGLGLGPGLGPGLGLGLGLGLGSSHRDEVLDPQPVRAGLIGVVRGGTGGERAFPLPLVHGGRRTCIVHTRKLGLQLCAC